MSLSCLRLAVPRVFGLMSIPVCGFARRAEDRPVSCVFRRTLPKLQGLMPLPCLRLAMPGVFGLMSMPVSDGARRALPKV